MTDRRVPHPLIPTFSNLRTATWIPLLALACLAPGARAADPSPVRRSRSGARPGRSARRRSHRCGWQGADRVTTWFETRVGDNVEPKVGNVAYLAYDDHLLLRRVRVRGPESGARSARRSATTTRSARRPTTAASSSTAGTTAKTALMFLANPRGVQYDAVSSDATGEDNAPDFFWDSAGKITATGWTLEIRIPFSSLRYASDRRTRPGASCSTATIRATAATSSSRARLPRDVNCFICNSSKLTGLAGLPHGSHLVVAPYATAHRSRPRRSAGSATPLENDDVDSRVRRRRQVEPRTPATAIDATINPDFSQIESDVAQITANERFALFFPEKRPFFLEGVDLFSTPIQAVYTRTITSPRGGLRATGRLGHDLVHRARRRRIAAAVGDPARAAGLRMRRPGLRSRTSAWRACGTTSGSRSSACSAPRARSRAADTTACSVRTSSGGRRRPTSFTGQMLWSESETPNRPDLATRSGTGARSRTTPAQLYWSHSTTDHRLVRARARTSATTSAPTTASSRRSATARCYVEGGYTCPAEGASFNRVRLLRHQLTSTRDRGRRRAESPPLGRRRGWTAPLNSFIRVELNHDEIRVGDEAAPALPPARLRRVRAPDASSTSSRSTSYVGDEIDFANAREGNGATILAR